MADLDLVSINAGGRELQRTDTSVENEKPRILVLTAPLNHYDKQVVSSPCVSSYLPMVHAGPVEPTSKCHEV